MIILHFTNTHCIPSDRELHFKMLPYKTKKHLLHSECKSEHNLTSTLLKNEGKNKRNRKQKHKEKRTRSPVIFHYYQSEEFNKRETRSNSLHRCFIMSTRKYIPRDATIRRSRKNQVSQAPIILVSLADFLQENWSSLIKPVMSLRMSGNSSAIYVLQMSGRVVASQQRRPPARPQSWLRMRTRICLFLSIAVQAELPSGGETRRQTDLRHFSWPVLLFIFWAKSHQIST